MQVNRGRGKSAASPSRVTEKAKQEEKGKRKRVDASPGTEANRQKRDMKRVVNVLERIVEETAEAKAPKVKRAPRRGKPAVKYDDPSSSFSSSSSSSFFSSDTLGRETDPEDQDLFDSRSSHPTPSTTTSQRPKRACLSKAAHSPAAAPTPTNLDKGKQKASNLPASPPPPTSHWMWVLESETNGREGFGRLRERCEAFYNPPLPEEVDLSATVAQPRAFSPMFQERNLRVMPVPAFGPWEARDAPTEEDMRRWGAYG